MKQLPSLLLFLLISSLVFLITGCGGAPSEEPVAQAAPAEEEKAVPVEIALTDTGPMSLILTYAGTLEAKDSVEVIPGAAGRIESVMVEVGDRVEAGDPIAIIEDDTYLVQLQQAEAAVVTAKLNLAKMELGSRPEEIAAAQAAVRLARAAVNDVATIDDNERTQAAADLARAEAALRTAQTEYDKIAWAGDVGQTPQALALQQATIAYENALANYNLDTNPSDSQLSPLMLQLAQAELQLSKTVQPYREIDFEMARTSIKQAEAALEQVNLQLKEIIITAPFDGIIAELNVSQGSRVGPQTNAALFVSEAVEVSVSVPENQISQIAEGQSASLQVTAYPGQDFPGVVTSISPVADKNSRTFIVKVTPTKGTELLRSGMYANVSILTQEKDETLQVPRSAVTSVDNQPTVYVVNGDNVVEQQPVTTGLSDTDDIEILSGLKAGDAVVTIGQTNLVDGMKVEVINDPRIAE